MSRPGYHEIIITVGQCPVIILWIPADMAGDQEAVAFMRQKMLAEYDRYYSDKPASPAKEST